MNSIRATPARSAINSQENVPIGSRGFKSLTNSAHKSLKGTPSQENPSARKKLSHLPNSQFNTPSARRAFGNVSNTPNINGSLKLQMKPATKDDCFVKPLQLGTPEHRLKGSKIESTPSVRCGPTLPTVYEEIENCNPISKKDLRNETDPLCVVDMWNVNVNHFPFDNDDESQKENRKMTEEELFDLL